MNTRFRLLWALPLATGLVSCTTATFKPRLVESVGIYPAGTQQLLTDAKLQFRLGNFALAIDQFRKAARQSPENVDAYNGLAASYDRLGRFDLSRRYYEQALALAPEDPKVRHNFAVSLRMQGRLGEALAFEAEMDGGHRQGSESASIAIGLVPTSPAPAVKNLPAAVRQEGLERISIHEVTLVTKMPAQSAKAAAAERIQIAPLEEISLGKTSLRVMNAVGRKGQAARMRAYLGNKGWGKVAVGDAADRRNKSVILYPVGCEASARLLAGHLPFKTPVRVSEKATRIVLLLGLNSAPFDDRLRLDRKKG
jgi:tetratricopeptide (TPR) repeat protein